MSLSVGFPRAYEEHDVLGQHINEMATPRAWPKIVFWPHRDPLILDPAEQLIPNTYKHAHLFRGVPPAGRREGWEGEIIIRESPGLQGELAVVVKYAFSDVGLVYKRAFVQMNYRVHSIGTDMVPRLAAVVGGYIPPYIRTEIAVCLEQESKLAATPAAYEHRENSDCLIIPGRLLKAGDIIIIEDFIRDVSHPEDTHHDMFIMDVDVIAKTRLEGDIDMPYMFEGEADDVAVGASATVDTTVLVDAPSPDIFSKKGILKHIEVIASTPPGASTSFSVEVYADSGYTELLYSIAGQDSSVSPYGLLTRDESVIFKNEDSPQEKKLYVRIIEGSGNATDFDIVLRGSELK